MLIKIFEKNIDDENIKNRAKKLKEKYFSYLNITRFQIPIIGSVSEGKSTLLNYLLDMKNFLETGVDLTTRALFIIRHNKNYKYPVISNLTIEERDSFKYNFLKMAKKGEEEYELNNNYIKEYNIFLNQKEMEKIQIEYYFLLIEVDIPFFHSEFEKYADIIEFIDIPGLNEKKEEDKKENINENKGNNTYTYSYQIIPFIQPNYIFSIFIFKTMNFEKTDASKIILGFQDVNYLNCLNIGIYEKIFRKININKVFKQSLFILNQENNEESCLLKFKEYLYSLLSEKSKESIINFEEGRNTIEANLKILNLEENRFNSFEDYLNYTIYNSELNNSGLIKSFTEYFIKDFGLNLSYIKINRMKDSALTKEQKEEINKINNIIKRDKYKLKYQQYKILNESFSDNLINKKNQTKSHALKEMIKNNIKTIIDTYLDVSQLNDLIYDIKSYLSKKNMKSIDDVFLKMQRVKKKNKLRKSKRNYL